MRWVDAILVVTSIVGFGVGKFDIGPGMANCPATTSGKSARFVNPYCIQVRYQDGLPSAVPELQQSNTAVSRQPWGSGRTMRSKSSSSTSCS